MTWEELFQEAATHDVRLEDIQRVLAELRTDG